MQAAKHSGVPAWELERQHVKWMHRAVTMMHAEYASHEAQSKRHG